MSIAAFRIARSARHRQATREYAAALLPVVDGAFVIERWQEDAAKAALWEGGRIPVFWIQTRGGMSGGNSTNELRNSKIAPFDVSDNATNALRDASASPPCRRMTSRRRPSWPYGGDHPTPHNGSVMK